MTDRIQCEHFCADVGIKHQLFVDLLEGYILLIETESRDQVSEVRRARCTPIHWHSQSAVDKSSLVNTPQKYNEIPLWQTATEKCNLQNKSDWAECPFA